MQAILLFFKKNLKSGGVDTLRSWTGNFGCRIFQGCESSWHSDQKLPRLSFSDISLQSRRMEYSKTSLNHPPGTCWETGSGFPPQQKTQCHRDHYSSLCFYFGHGNNKENTRMMLKVHPLELKEPLGTGPPSVADTERGLFAPPLETGPQLATAPNSLLQIPPASNHHQVDAGVRRLKVTAARAC